MRRGRDLLNRREVSQELLDLMASQLSRVPQLVKTNEAPDPVDVCLLRTKAVVIVANARADLIQQPLCMRGLSRVNTHGFYVVQ